MSLLRTWLRPRQDHRQPVLLYDGECGLCNAVVRALLRLDPQGRLKFAPLQGAPAQAYLRVHRLPATDFDSLVFVRDWQRREQTPPLVRTDGALAALDEVGGFPRIVSWLRIVPRGLRDPVYRLIARLRYTIFGEYRPRPLANPAWQARFIE